MLISLFFSFNANALMEMTNEEYALLPDYCHHKKYVSTRHPTPPPSRQWEDFFGSDFLPVHHYCWALIWNARSYRSGQTDAERQFKLMKANDDIQFVLDNTSQTFPLRAELYTQQIEIRSRKRDPRGAERAYKDAIAADKNYWKAYWTWGYWLSRQNRSNDAIPVVQEGLSHSPENARLLSLLKELRKPGKTKGE